MWPVWCCVKLTFRRVETRKSGAKKLARKSSEAAEGTPAADCTA